MMVNALTEIISDDEHLKLLATIIEYRCNNILKTKKLLEKDINKLYQSKNKRLQDKICLDIAIKMDYIEILLSKNIDDAMTYEIFELDKNYPPELPIVSNDDGNHYYQ
jgi:hypothetical protein